MRYNGTSEPCGRWHGANRRQKVIKKSLFSSASDRCWTRMLDIVEDSPFVTLNKSIGTLLPHHGAVIPAHHVLGPCARRTRMDSKRSRVIGTSIHTVPSAKPSTSRLVNIQVHKGGQKLEHAFYVHLFPSWVQIPHSDHSPCLNRRSSTLRII